MRYHSAVDACPEPVHPQPHSTGNPGAPVPCKDVLGSLTCKHASDDGTHTRQEVGEGPAEATGELSRHCSHRPEP